MAEKRMRNPSIPCQMQEEPPFVTAEKNPPRDCEGVVAGDVVTNTFTKSPVQPRRVRRISVATMESLRGLQLLASGGALHSGRSRDEFASNPMPSRRTRGHVRQLNHRIWALLKDIILR